MFHGPKLDEIQMCAFTSPTFVNLIFSYLKSTNVIGCTVTRFSHCLMVDISGVAEK